MKARIALLFCVLALVAASCGGGYRTCATYSKATPVVEKADKPS